MSVTTIGKVEVDLLTASTTYTVNMVFRALLEIARGRGLSSAYLTDRHESIEEGLYIWLSENSLLKVHLEVSLTHSEKALERFELAFEYVTDAKMELEKPNVERLRDFCRQLQTLPPGAEYRMLVSLERWASEVPGWTPSYFKELDADTETSITSFGYGAIGTTLVYRGASWDNEV